MKPLNTKTLTSKEREYQEMCSYMEREVRLGADLRWFITFQFQDPDDKCRADNKIESKSEKVTKYKSLTKLSYLNETSYDGWMRDRYSDLDWIYRDTNAVNRRINKHLFGVDHLNNDIYNRPKSKNKRPYLYYFHERGKYGKYRKDKEYHTHLVLPDIPNMDELNLEIYFNFKSKFRSLKCISNSRNIHIEEMNSEEAFGYLTKESSRFNIALDPFNSFTIQRNNDSNSNKRASS